MAYDLTSHPEAKARKAAEASAPARPGRRKSILAATKEGPKSTLEALRDGIAAQLDAGVPPRDWASLSKRLMELEDQLAAMTESEVGDIASAAEVPDEPFTG